MKQLLIVIALGCMVFLTAVTAYAANKYYDNHSEGWYWYKSTHKDTNNTGPAIDPSKHPVAAMNRLHKLEQQAIDRAYFNPTVKNVKDYIMLQRLVQNRAYGFSNTWKKTLLLHPELDYSLRHATTSQGMKIYTKLVGTKNDKIIQKFARHHGLFFFYEGDCPYCHRFAPILKQFAQHYHMRLLPISTGHGFLPEFPNSKRDNGQAALLHVAYYPALYAVNPKTHRIIPISYGLLSYQDLKQRVVNVATDFMGS